MATLCPLLAAACGGEQSTLSPASDSSETISDLWWVMLIGSVIVFAVVLALLLVGVLRRRGQEADERPPVGAGKRLVAIGGMVVPAAVLVVLFGMTLNAIPATSPSTGTGALTIDVTGRQWFWDIAYAGDDFGFRTANEIHVPVGEPVTLRVHTGDVIHSLWIPRLNRKIDMIPGQTNELTVEAREAGTFRAQCAEFCGLQHAKMALYVVAEPREDFEAWAARQALPAVEPATERLVEGQQTFLGSACVYCHTIAGTNASGRIGPDLTHLASRLSLGAATIPNSRGYLAGWILDPQHIKPGNKMPGTSFEGDELQPLLDYLESLE